LARFIQDQQYGLFDHGPCQQDQSLVAKRQVTERCLPRQPGKPEPAQPVTGRRALAGGAGLVEADRVEETRADDLQHGQSGGQCKCNSGETQPIFWHTCQSDWVVSGRRPKNRMSSAWACGLSP